MLEVLAEKVKFVSCQALVYAQSGDILVEAHRNQNLAAFAVIIFAS